MKKLILMIAFLMALPVSATFVIVPDPATVSYDQKQILGDHCKKLLGDDTTSVSIINRCMSYANDKRLTYIEGLDVYIDENLLNNMEKNINNEYMYPNKLSGVYRAYSDDFIGTLMEYSPNSSKYFINLYKDGVYIGYLPVTGNPDSGSFNFISGGIYHIDPGCSDGHVSPNDNSSYDADYEGSYAIEIISNNAHIYKLDMSMPYEHTGPVYRMSYAGCSLEAGGEQTLTYYPIEEDHIIYYGNGDHMIIKPIDSIPID